MKKNKSHKVQHEYYQENNNDNSVNAEEKVENKKEEHQGVDYIPFAEQTEEKKDTPVIEKKEVVFPDHQGFIHHHISFGTRVLVMTFFVFLGMLISTFLIYKAFTYNHKESVTYSEQSNLNYQVCLKENDFYNAGCLEEEMEYVSVLIDNIPISFQYSSTYTKTIPYKYQYYIVGRIKIYDKDDASKVLYKNEEILSEKQELSGTAPGFNFSTSINVDYSKYNDYVNKYKDRYSLNSGSELDVVLMLEENAKAREIGTVIIPLSDQTFSIKKEAVLKQNQIKTVEENVWNIVNYAFVLAGVICILLVFGMIIRIIKLLYKISSKTSKYQVRLEHILREFDRIIVVSKDKYRIEEGKQMIKVDSFEELLDARDTLEKPIVYVKVNNIKSEFYVEDEHRIYKYTMKEVDFE